MTSVDLTAFAPDDCGFGHDLRVGAGYRRVSSFPCLCAGLARHHIKVHCAGCEADGRKVAFYDPPHAWYCPWCAEAEVAEPMTLCPACAREEDAVELLDAHDEQCGCKGNHILTVPL